MRLRGGDNLGHGNEGTGPSLAVTFLCHQPIHESKDIGSPGKFGRPQVDLMRALLLAKLGFHQTHS